MSDFKCKRCKDKGLIPYLKHSVHDKNGKFLYDVLGLIYMDMVSFIWVISNFNIRIIL